MDDAESLFGSPPPSPTRGRSPSPALALPNISANIINLSNPSAQNVGTIALPGSHNFSELPVNPLALSLSYPAPPRGDALRPPAHISDRSITQLRTLGPFSPSPVASPAPLKRKPTKKSKPRSQSSTPRPTPPPIHLPDPSHPLPPNLLRNQPGLLGTAGVVAGVRPADLTVPAPAPALDQGMTPSNPILIHDSPKVYTKPRRSTPSEFDGIDMASLPVPSNQEIISMLIEQGDIFPLLESISKFISATPARAASETPSQSSFGDSGSRAQTPASEMGPAKKRRRLRHVPAGAALWDVPFPFNPGEGPSAYRNNWEKHRGKDLVAELVTLIKDAAKKAAMKSHLEKRKGPTDAQIASLSKYYRVETLFYPSSKSPEAEVLADTSNANHSTSTFDFIPSPSLVLTSEIPSHSSSTSSPFDQLLTSLLSASSNQPSSSSSSSSILDGFFDSSTSSDTSLYDSWMDILQAFPMPAEGFAQALPPVAPPGDLHINPMQTLSTITEYVDPPQNPNPSPFDLTPDFSSFPDAAALSGNTDYFPGSLDEFMMDPALLAFQTANFPPPIDTNMSASTSNFSGSDCPSLAGSPIPSVSSWSFGPMTPTDSTSSMDAGIGIFSPGEEERASAGVSAPGGVQTDGLSFGSASGSSSMGKKRDFGEMSGWTNGEREAYSFLEVLSTATATAKGKDKGKGKAKAAEGTGNDREGEGDEVVAAQDEFSKLRTLPIMGALVKAEVLKKAKKRREELAAQIDATRVALWETTIEGGVLAGLVKHYSAS
ncbi:hypothetical protein R3P38DRAFT_2920657 [Favolaschia claudopus]|uniref:Uncharacterized protein n=1 Tax=Favolaschia claudopus TaxID=2862362 RepID=A0AAW0C1R1_9AGAR